MMTSSETFASNPNTPSGSPFDGNPTTSREANPGRPPRFEAVEGGDRRERAVAAGSNDFERMVRLLKSNESLFEELRALRRRIQGVRAYLADPSGNPAVGRAFYTRLRAKHSGVLALLRANRIEAQQILDKYDPTATQPLRERFLRS